MSRQKPEDWEEAKRRCRLSDQEIEMAKKLGFQATALIRKIPAPSGPWKMPVKDWIRSLYEEKFPQNTPTPSPQPRPRVVEFRNPAWPWPDKPEIPALVLDDPFDDDIPPFEEGQGFYVDLNQGQSVEEEAEEDDIRMLRRQCLYRWAAQSIAVELNNLDEVRKLAAFGAAARPLEREVPRFKRLKRRGIKIWHECTDLDLAVWMTDLDDVRQLSKAIHRALSSVQDTPYGGVAHHQVDVHLMDAETGAYRGRRCVYATCPKGKPECFVPGCGEFRFVQQFAKYDFNPDRFEAERYVILLDKATGFVVRRPEMNATPTIFRPRKSSEDIPFGDDDDVAF